MEDAPCGCEQYDDAQRARPGEREGLLAQCGDNARAWACPRAGHTGDPTDARKEVLRRVEILTGCDRGSLRSCPRHETSGSDVARALRIYRAQQQGGVTFDEDPPAAIVLASEVIGASDGRRIDREQEERKHDGG